MGYVPIVLEVPQKVEDEVIIVETGCFQLELKWLLHTPADTMFLGSNLSQETFTSMKIGDLPQSR